MTQPPCKTCRSLTVTNLSQRDTAPALTLAPALALAPAFAPTPAPAPASFPAPALAPASEHGESVVSC